MAKSSGSRVSQAKTPRSSCVQWAVWDSEQTFSKGTRPHDRSLGRMTLKFHKTAHIYCTRRRITLGLFSNWLTRKLGSVGKLWNARLRGNY